jgi:hypothetical protein
LNGGLLRGMEKNCDEDVGERKGKGKREGRKWNR